MSHDPTRPDPVVLDPDQFDAVCAGDAEFEREIVQEFERQAGVALQSIEAAQGRGDADALRRAAHSLKGSARSLGGEALGAACGQLEALGSSGDPAEAAPAVQRAREECARLIQVLRAHLARHAA